MIIHNKPVAKAGRPLSEAKKVLVMLHGRGGNAKDFVQLSEQLSVEDFAFLAPQAIQSTWYPYSFLAPVEKNEPQLSLSLSGLSELLDDINGLGFSSPHIYFLGFSQGACLALEFCARHAKRYGGIIAFTGGLIGEKINTSYYRGDFEGTPIFIGSSDHDLHVPKNRIDESEEVLTNLGAQVYKKIYPGMGHTIIQDEIEITERILNEQSLH